jgi:hypothetical protein
MGHFILDGAQFAQLESGIFDQPDFAAGKMFVDQDGSTLLALPLDLAQYLFAFQHEGEDVAGVARPRRIFGDEAAQQAFGVVFPERLRFRRRRRDEVGLPGRGSMLSLRAFQASALRSTRVYCPSRQ